MTIIISKSGKNAKKVEQTHIVQEDYLQSYIYDNPDAIPIYEIEENIRLLILAREFMTASGPIDAVGIDQNGNIYLIETKLYKNLDKRMVVAQVLDYGASLWRSSIDFNEFTARLEKHVNKQFTKGLNQLISEFFELQMEDVGAVLEHIRANLGSGTFKFVILMDKVHQQLKDLVLFINQNSQFDVFAVELEYYKHEDFEIMIPKVHGTEVKKAVVGPAGGASRRKWDETSFFEHASEQLGKHPQYLQAVQKLYVFSKEVANSISWGTGVTRSSFTPKILILGEIRSPYTVWSNGVIGLNFLRFIEGGTDTLVRDAFKRELEERKLFLIPKDYEKRSLEFPIDRWYLNVDSFIEAIHGLISIGTQSPKTSG